MHAVIDARPDRSAPPEPRPTSADTVAQLLDHLNAHILTNPVRVRGLIRVRPAAPETVVVEVQVGTIVFLLSELSARAAARALRQRARNPFVLVLRTTRFARVADGLIRAANDACRGLSQGDLIREGGR